MMRNAVSYGVLMCLGAVLGVRPAAAFCRSTTQCKSDECAKNEQGCPKEGIPVRWPSPCISFSLNRKLSAKYDPEKTRAVFMRAIDTWMLAKCPVDEFPSCNGDENCHPSVKFQELPKPKSEDSWEGVSCSRSEDSSTFSNVNVLFFNDSNFFYRDKDNTLARTLTYKNTKTGDITGADMEINSDQIILSVETQPPERSYDELGRPVYDLQSIVTHELGHFMGLAHTEKSDSSITMYSSYNSDQRTLKEDDIRAICTVYKPNSKEFCDPTPRNGFSGDCAETASTGKPASYCTYAEGGVSSVFPGVSSGAGFLAVAAVLRWRRQRSATSKTSGIP
jgi:Matrixin